MTNHHDTINYLEIPARSIDKAKQFFGEVFNWHFVDYGDDYCAFSTPTIEGGFYRTDKTAATDKGSILIVFYSDNLAATQANIERCGGSIVKPTFSFPGGRRFHFADPNGCEYAVWSDK